MGGYPGLPGWAQCNHKGPPYKWDVGGEESEKEMRLQKQEIRVMGGDATSQCM